MEGAALREKKAFDLALVTAWHVVGFGAEGFNKNIRGKSLTDFLVSVNDKPRHPSHAQGIAFFHKLKAKGVAVEITREEMN